MLRIPAFILALALLPAPPIAADPLIKVAAKVGTDIITTTDIDDAIAEVAASMSPEERESPEGKQKLAEARKNVLDHMIEMKLVILAAKEGPPGFADAEKDGKAPKNPYLPESSEIEAEMEKVFDQTRLRYNGQDEFEAALGKEHVTVPEYRNRLREQVRDQMTYMNMEKIKEREFGPSLHVSDDEAKAYYNENLQRFYQGPRVRLRHILFPLADEAKAKRLLQELKRAPNVKEAFIQAAKKYSADTATKDQGGLLDWIEKGQSWHALEDVAFAAKDETLAGPVETEAGWHLLYIEGHQPGKQNSFEDVKKSAANQLYQEKLKKHLDDWVKDLKTKYYVDRQGDSAS
jgi:hypothetical protein